MSTQRILVVDDESDIRTLLKEILSEEGYEVDVAADAGQARSSRARQSPDLCLLDIWMPDTDGITLLREWSRGQGLDFPVVMMSGHGTVETAVEATRLGAFDFVEKPLSLAKLLRTVERALDLGKHRKQSARATLPTLLAPVGKSRTMMALREQVQQVAPHSAPVLLTGESGTGREAFARYVHARSGRAEKPFVMVVAGNLSEAAVEAQLRHAPDNAFFRAVRIDVARAKQDYATVLTTAPLRPPEPAAGDRTTGLLPIDTGNLPPAPLPARRRPTPGRRP